MIAQSLPSPRFLVDVFSLIKPRITLLTIITTLVGIRLTSMAISTPKMLITLFGTACLVGGANALNMFMERDIDLLMKRTQNRPLPGQRLTPDFVLGFGSLLIGISIPLLTSYVNPLTGLLGALSLVSYLLFYTPLKRKSSLAVWVGAVPGAMPPVLGWSAATGSLNATAWVLFGIIFFWQIPHFYAIGLFRKEEYAKAGFKIYTLEATSQAIYRQIVLFTLITVATSLLLVPLKIGGSLYYFAAIFLGVLFLGAAILKNKNSSLEVWAKRLFMVSLIYLTGLFGVLFFQGGN